MPLASAMVIMDLGKSIKKVRTVGKSPVRNKIFI